MTEKKPKKSFSFVRIPAEETEEIEQWNLEYDNEDEVGCLMNRLQRHYREEDERIASSSTEEQKEERRARIEATVRENMSGAAPPGLATGDQQKQMQQALSTMTHLVAQVPLLDPSKETGFEQVAMYVNDFSVAKGLPQNSRATAVCAAVGTATEIRGDAFVARVVDDGADIFRRVDFTVSELSSAAPWVSKAVEARRKRPRATQDDLQRFLESRKTQKTARPADEYKCAVCGNPASQRCSRCKATRYCGAEHQKVDWPKHKLICKP